MRRLITVGLGLGSLLLFAGGYTAAQHPILAVFVSWMSIWFWRSFFKAWPKLVLVITLLVGIACFSTAAWREWALVGCGVFGGSVSGYASLYWKDQDEEVGADRAVWPIWIEVAVFLIALMTIL